MLHLLMCLHTQSKAAFHWVLKGVNACNAPNSTAAEQSIVFTPYRRVYCYIRCTLYVVCGGPKDCSLTHGHACCKCTSIAVRLFITCQTGSARSASFVCMPTSRLKLTARTADPCPDLMQTFYYQCALGIDSPKQIEHSLLISIFWKYLLKSFKIMKLT